MAAESFLERYIRESLDGNKSINMGTIEQNSIECLQEEYVGNSYEMYQFCMDSNQGSALVDTLPPNLQGRFIFAQTMADGNCLFHAIAEGIKHLNPRSTHDHITLRALICQHYNNARNIEDLGVAAISLYNNNTEQTRRDYIQYICANGAFGLDNEISILSRITPYHIEAYTVDGIRTTVLPPLGKQIIYIWNHNLQVNSPINHYTLLIPRRGSLANLAALAPAFAALAPAFAAPAPAPVFAALAPAFAAPAPAFAAPAPANRGKSNIVQVDSRKINTLAAAAAAPAPRLEPSAAQKAHQREVRQREASISAAASASADRRIEAVKLAANSLEPANRLKFYDLVANAAPGSAASARSLESPRLAANSLQAAVAKEANNSNSVYIRQQKRIAQEQAARQRAVQEQAAHQRAVQDVETQKLLASFAAENAQVERERATQETRAAAKAAGLSDKEIEALLKQKGGKHKGVNLANLAKLKY